MPRITSVDMYTWSGDSYCHGFKFYYQDGTAGKHYKADHDENNGVTKKHYKLEADEYICKVDGHFGAWCDNVRFTTNLGREIKAGGNGGSFYSCNLK